MMKHTLTVFAAAGALMGLAACQTETGPRLAVMSEAGDAEMAALKTVLSDAVGRTNVELGPADLTQDSSFTVLPPRPSPLETNSTAMPVQFELMIQGGDTCYVREVETNLLHRANGIGCKPASE